MFLRTCKSWILYVVPRSDCSVCGVSARVKTSKGRMYFFDMSVSGNDDRNDQLMVNLHWGNYFSSLKLIFVCKYLIIFKFFLKKCQYML